MNRFQVPPADLEAVLLTKDDVADAGVIGVENQEQATELPRFVSLFVPCARSHVTHAPLSY